MSTPIDFAPYPQDMPAEVAERSRLSLVPNVAPSPVVAPDPKACANQIELGHQAIRKLLRNFENTIAVRTDLEIVGSICREAMLALIATDHDLFSESILALATANATLSKIQQDLESEKGATLPKVLGAIAKANLQLEKAWDKLIPPEDE